MSAPDRDEEVPAATESHAAEESGARVAEPPEEAAVDDELLDGDDEPTDDEPSRAEPDHAEPADDEAEDLRRGDPGAFLTEDTHPGVEAPLAHQDVASSPVEPDPLDAHDPLAAVDAPVPALHAPVAAPPSITPPAPIPGAFRPINAGIVPLVPPAPVRPPRPPVIALRLDDGRGWQTPNLVLRTTDDSGSAYLDIAQPNGNQTVYLPVVDLRRLIQVATTPQLDAGVLWKKLSDIPLERPLPSRTLDEELRMLLLAHSGRTRG